MKAAFPEAQAQWIDPEAEEQMETLMAVIVAIRNIRGEMNVSPALKVEVVCLCDQGSELELLDRARAHHRRPGQSLQAHRRPGRRDREAEVRGRGGGREHGSFRRPQGHSGFRKRVEPAPKRARQTGKRVRTDPQEALKR